MLEGLVPTKLRQLGMNLQAYIFQQDGATALNPKNSMAVVRQIVGAVISRFSKTTWPAQSPYLSVPDFFL